MAHDNNSLPDNEAEWERLIEEERLAAENATIEVSGDGASVDEEVVDPFKVDAQAKAADREKEIASAEKPDEEEDPTTPEGYGNLRYLADQINVPPAELEEVLVSLLDKVEETEREAILRNPRNPLTRLLATRDTATTSAQATFMLEAMRQLKDAGAHLISSMDTTFRDMTSFGSGYTGQLSGATAATAFRARMNGLKKVYLYSSGFHIVIRSFTNAELNEFFTTCAHHSKELGHMLGGHFYLVHDLFIKKKFMELLPLAVVSCNLKSWRSGNTLASNISINDYDTLLWSVCSLMYTKGIQHDLVCANVDCRHETKNILMDIAKMRIVNTTALSEAAIEFIMAEKVDVTVKELKHYRDDLLSFEHEFVLKGIRFRLQTPTIQEYLTYAEGLYKVITAKAQGTKTTANTGMMTSAIIHYNRSFVPWIKEIALLDDAGKEVFSCNDQTGIHSVVDEFGSAEEDIKLNNEIKKFMASSRVSFIGYYANKCAKCGQGSSDTVDNFRAWDAQHLFFSLTYRRLEPIGIV